jgi:predicted hydrolase (HD superfamily)
MAITREQAWEKLCEWTRTDSLRKHARAVELVMREAATRYGPGPEAAELWGITGLLHDADYEQWSDEHPKRIVAWLRERGEEEIAYAVSAHYTTWGVAPKSALDKSLLACDELTGFIIACCLVRPDGIHTLTPKSVRKKLKDKAFAAKVDRGEVYSGIEALGPDLAEHVQFIVDALRPHAEELGLGGKGGPG